MGPVPMTLLLVGTLAVFSWSAFRRWRQLCVGGPEPRFSVSGDELTGRVSDTVRYALGQRKMPYYRQAGIAHMMIFGGFMVLLLRSLMLWGRGYDPTFDFWGVLASGSFLGDAYSLIKDIFAVLVIIGVAVFTYLRVGKQGRDSVEGRARMTLGFEGLLILLIIFTMMAGDIIYDGASIILATRAAGQPIAFHPWEPAGSVAAFAFGAVESPSALVAIQHLGFWVHSSLVLIFLNILPYSKHFHIITAIPNVFTRDRTPPGRLPKVEDLEGKVEREEPLGVAKLSDLSWKHVLDLYTCTECGRCSDNCPAYTTDKKLSPKHLTLALRDHLYESEDNLFAAQDDIVAGGHGASNGATGDGPAEIHTFPPPPEGAYFRSAENVPLVPHVLHPDVIWGCTTCRACEEQCPVMISYVDKIVMMRREEVMMKNEFPAELQGAFNGMETNGNPWNISAMDRGKWSEGLGVRTLAEHPGAEIIYWVGCAASYDDRAKKVARSLVRLLQTAGVDFAILGPEESCTGDSARRAGNEYLFQMLAEQNVETLNGYGAADKTIITACPHCFNTLANEYGDFGGNYRVMHHSELLAHLVRQGHLNPIKPVKGRVVYHDSCYLGRYNDVYRSPRSVLSSIPGVEVVEVPYWNRNKGLCCGAGGAQMWMEEQNDNRVNRKRTLQLLGTGAKTVASGCPFCMTMLTDGLKAEEKEEEVAQMDVAELLAQAVELVELPLYDEDDEDDTAAE